MIVGIEYGVIVGTVRGGAVQAVGGEGWRQMGRGLRRGRWWRKALQRSTGNDFSCPVLGISFQQFRALPSPTTLFPCFLTNWSSASESLIPNSSLMGKTYMFLRLIIIKNEYINALVLDSQKCNPNIASKSIFSMQKMSVATLNYHR